MTTNARSDCHFCSAMPRSLPPADAFRSDIASGSGGHSAQRAVFLTNTSWTTGEVVRIAFIGGTAEQRAHVQRVASQWLLHANLVFKYVADGAESDVRISFVKGGSWSYFGAQARLIKPERATMNFGWLPEKPEADDQGTILHEFGHMLGLGHEHQNPNGIFTWKRDVVIESLSGPPNKWTVEQIEGNVLNRYDGESDTVHASDFDPDSIMLYSFPPEWNEEGVKTTSNSALSHRDKCVIGKMYPYEEITIGDGDSEHDCNDDPSEDDDSEQETPKRGCCPGAGPIGVMQVARFINLVTLKMRRRM